jgi:hypothetical protein
MFYDRMKDEFILEVAENEERAHHPVLPSFICTTATTSKLSVSRAQAR